MEYGSIWQSQICPQVLASIIKQNVLTVGPDLQTAGEIPRDDNGNDHTSMKIALWNVNGAASKEEEINDMMRGSTQTAEFSRKPGYVHGIYECFLHTFATSPISAYTHTWMT